MGDRGDRGGISLLVRNISRRLRPEDIRKEFERYGEVRDVYIPKDYYTKEPKGFAFVEFRSEREADDARRNLDGVRIDGRDIRVVFAQERRKSTDQMRERESSSLVAIALSSEGTISFTLRFTWPLACTPLRVPGPEAEIGVSSPLCVSSAPLNVASSTLTVASPL
ncbi:Arginine/serine-rich splicing factor scl25a transcript I [Phytophthora boehmeriae]|uniref:Arginine/serine-rich splicing factor scl25a transcript I n=1 Tax=Phytophthora boehmeriae TaxID=109152 RepID=A0A8T1XDS5_9STRA|nr:Arginine/serine-rich splicing factor scl25a transcript I [Phytophthora boehmeriae]